MSPSSAELLREAGRLVHPPEQVCRVFDFADGIPSEYSSFTGEDYRREGHTIEHIVPLSVWRNTVAQEQTRGTGHALPSRDAHSVS